MISLITSKKAQNKVAQNIRALRLEKGYTQKGLSERSGVSYASLRKFEQTGIISLESFFKLAMVLGCLEKLIEATQPIENEFSSIDEVLDKKQEKKPKRGWRK
ncbi:MULTISPECIES: helix-turn-helix domain-containing protein [Flavobacteriaceae]|uniref:helix-turn-helix domain-containing protein n=1 Tax=Flavobacteriaceae TaxID=49546 RepID=UPI0014920E08|nr:MULTISPECIES: helix-turn-helix transcriptional regulator [Allomuricauda]MDC6365664.1 helix-turn-helix transcriptional regulator [Muricauda sp. AC10]